MCVLYCVSIKRTIKTGEHSAMPRMNWSSADIAGTFSLFKQKCQILFAVKEIKRENMVNYILMYIGDEGLRIYNLWTLSENDKADPNVVWTKFESHIEPKVNFRVQRFYLQKYSQCESESIDDYVVKVRSWSRRWRGIREVGGPGSG